MRIALVTAGTRGDVQPMVALGVELSRRRHDVVLGVPPNLGDLARGAGLVALPIGPDSRAFLESEDGRAWLASGNMKAFLDALAKIAHEMFPSMTADTVAACQGADLVVTGVLREDCVACIAEAAEVPMVVLHTSPHRPTRAYPSYLVTTRSLPGPLNQLTGTLFERTWWKRMRADINAFRTELGLPTTTRPTPVRLAAAELLELQAYSEQLVPGIDDYGARRPFVGFLGLDASTRALLGEVGVSSELDSWLCDGEPPIYFGFGSMPIAEPDATLSMVTDVARSLGVRALVSAGWGHLGRTGDTGDNQGVMCVGALDHAAVLPRCRAAVHHGGAGTTAASLSAGLATLACSVFADQPFWGTRLEELGVGAHRRFSALDRRTLESGLREVLDPSTAKRAQDLGKALVAEDGAVLRAADLVESAT